MSKPYEVAHLPYEFDDEALTQAWINHGLKAEFPYIAAESRLGRLMLGTYMKLEDLVAEGQILENDDDGLIENQREQSIAIKKKDIAQNMIRKCRVFTKRTSIREIDGVGLMNHVIEVTNSENLKLGTTYSNLDSETHKELTDWVSTVGLFLFSGSGNFGSGHKQPSGIKKS